MSAESLEKSIRNITNKEFQDKAYVKRTKSRNNTICVDQNTAEKHSVVLHYHDVCPKPFFSLERTGKEIQSDITLFLKKRGCTPRFSDDGSQFTVERGI